MPYIPREERPSHRIAIDILTNNLSKLADENKVGGNLNYVISSICKGYLEKSGGVRYYKLEKLIGCLECVKQELYRRVAADYENEAIEKNGDI